MFPLVRTIPEERPFVAAPRTAHALEGSHEAEVLTFLSERPVHTAGMVGFIRDHGLVSPLNRGTFYGCRDAEGRLEGVALIGHAILFETRTVEALASFARLARECPRTHMVLGECEKVQEFWRFYSAGDEPARLACREVLLEQRWPVAVRDPVAGLRLATLADLELVIPVQAQLAYEESQVNPLERDPEGFRQRCVNRIEMGRTWVWVEDGRLVFKAEVVSDTPEVIYLEGIWVNPRDRGKGYALRCMSQMSRGLLQRTRALSILVNERNQVARKLYQRAGYRLSGFYDTIFLP
jgi:ribosomal protein S18 acetylase RimI-like enzyme